jgi:protein phosphatase 1L
LDRPSSAIKNVYNWTDGNFFAKATDLGPGGSTTVTTILVDVKKLFVANIGDSRVVLCKSGTVIQLIIDHEPNIECQNIDKKGGFVTLLLGTSTNYVRKLMLMRAYLNIIFDL